MGAHVGPHRGAVAAVAARRHPGRSAARFITDQGEHCAHPSLPPGRSALPRLPRVPDEVLHGPLHHAQRHRRPGVTRVLRPTGQTPFQSVGDPHALCVQGRAAAVSFFVANPKGHPFDSGPIATIDRLRVAELVKALTARLVATRAAVPTVRRGAGPDCECGHHRRRCLIGYQHTWSMPWLVDGHLMRDMDTAHCATCGAVCTGDER